MDWLRAVLDTDVAVVLNIVLTLISIFDLARKTQDKMKKTSWKVIIYLILTICLPVWLIIVSDHYSGWVYVALQLFSWLTLSGVAILAAIMLYIHKNTTLPKA